MVRPILIGALSVLAGAAAAQDIGGAGGGQSCIDVRIGAEQYYNCLNRDLARAVPERRFSAADAPYGAASPPHAIGGFNQTATRQMLGRNFGRSVFPERPPR